MPNSQDSAYPRLPSDNFFFCAAGASETSIHERAVQARPSYAYLVPRTMYQVLPGTWYQVPGTWYLVPGTRYLVPGTHRTFGKYARSNLNSIRTFEKYGFVLSESTNYIEKVWSRVENQKSTYSINIFRLLIFFAIYNSRNYIWRPALLVANVI